MSRSRLTPAIRQKIIDRAVGCCEYCHSQARFATYTFSVEHIVPLSKGGTDTIDNLALACQGCNSHKYTKTEAIDPLSQLKVPLFHPRKDRWSTHFTWSTDFSEVLGLTPTGRATCASLQLNRGPIKHLRKVLFAAGMHPPGDLLL
ncbi:MAG: HNH endonuclease [Bacteroidetes bacterium]|nr:MAG: HNH endonuclease [Bacteroidota bacterium]